MPVSFYLEKEARPTMVPGMKLWIIAWIAAAAFGLAAEMPPVEKAIPATVKALGDPTAIEMNGGLRMAVTASTEKAQAHVLQGMNHLNGGWEFEASRHFAAAMKEDPECLLAHWGMVMCLLSPSPETDEARIAASERLMELIEQGKGSELERGYAYGLVKFLSEGVREAANAFHKVSERFPNDLQTAILSALFSRSGYDDLGEPTPDQLRAEQTLEALIAKHPESPLPLHALLLIRAEAPDLTGSLDLARKLTRMVPNYAPYFHLLGHYEWRCGQHGKATSAFSRAVTLLERWRESEKISLADCPEWVRSECYRIIAVSSNGDFETAYAASRRVSEIPLPEGRPGSAGARILLWEARTLPARLLMKRGLPGNTEEALFSLPKPDDLKATRGTSLASWWVDGLRIFLDAKRAAETGKLEEAKVTAAALSKHGAAFEKMQSASSQGGERSAWLRAFRAMEVLASELNGQIALASPPNARGSAYNWFRSAADRQHPSSLLFPPAILAPMTSRVGDYFMAVGRQKDATEAFEEALRQFPNDIDTLRSLQASYSAAGMTAEAEKTAITIRTLEEDR
jgi:tetratricopeptide (TPR) repeat protein